MGRGACLRLRWCLGAQAGVTVRAQVTDPPRGRECDGMRGDERPLLVGGRREWVRVEKAEAGGGMAVVRCAFR